MQRHCSIGLCSLIWTFDLRVYEKVFCFCYCCVLVRILNKSIAGRFRPVRVADGPISARYRFIKNASWGVCLFSCFVLLCFAFLSCCLYYLLYVSVTFLLADENEYRLIRDLFINYDKRVRPSIHHSQPVNITYGVALAQIIDVVS